MTPQELLFDAHKRGITLFCKKGGRLGFKPVRLCPPEFREQLRAHKQQLLTLLGDLERYGAAGDPLILEALALFNASPKGLVESPTLPFPAAIGPHIALEVAGVTSTKPYGSTSDFLEGIR
jgi:hypothetical protein